MSMTKGEGYHTMILNFCFGILVHAWPRQSQSVPPYLTSNTKPQWSTKAGWWYEKILLYYNKLKPGEWVTTSCHQDSYWWPNGNWSLVPNMQLHWDHRRMMILQRPKPVCSASDMPKDRPLAHVGPRKPRYNRQDYLIYHAGLSIIIPMETKSYNVNAADSALLQRSLGSHWGNASQWCQPHLHTSCHSAV